MQRGIDIPAGESTVISGVDPGVMWSLIHGGALTITYEVDGKKRSTVHRMPRFTRWKYRVLRALKLRLPPYTPTITINDRDEK